MTMSRTRGLLTALLLMAMALVAQAANLNLLMGNPSHATTVLTNKNNYLMEKPYCSLSYHNRRGTPNWVSWRLTKQDIGTAPRVDFYPDQTLPTGFRRVTPAEYTGGGFDRGHLCPHSDRSATPAMSRATFVMTNMMPQSPNVNRKAWERLEAYCRDLALRGNTLYIIDGPAGQGGTGERGTKQTIGVTTPVTVPAKCWKVMMVLKKGTGSDLQRVTTKTRLIAVIMPNNMSVGEDWAKYRVSVAAVEKLTGYTFFDKVPAAKITPLKQKVDRQPI